MARAQGPLELPDKLIEVVLDDPIQRYQIAVDIVQHLNRSWLHTQHWRTWVTHSHPTVTGDKDYSHTKGDIFIYRSASGGQRTIPSSPYSIKRSEMPSGQCPHEAAAPIPIAANYRPLPPLRPAWRRPSARHPSRVRIRRAARSGPIRSGRSGLHRPPRSACWPGWFRQVPSPP